MKSSIAVLVFALSIMVALVSHLTVQSMRSSSKMIIVPDDYSTIQEAINAASDGDTVFVRNGTYHENVLLDRGAISLIGENKHGTIVDGGGTGHIVQVESNGVCVTGFTIRGSYTEFYYYALFLADINDCNISDNIISNSYRGVLIRRGVRNIFCGNTITDNYLGALLTQMQYATLKDNNLTNNRYACHIFALGRGNDIDASNTVNGKPIYCLTDQEDTTISPSAFPEMSYLALSDSTRAR